MDGPGKNLFLKGKDPSYSFKKCEPRFASFSKR